MRSWSARKYFAEASSSSWSRAKQPWLSCSTCTCTSMASSAARSMECSYESGPGFGGEQGGQYGVAAGDQLGRVDARQLVVHARHELGVELRGERDLAQVAPPRLGRRPEVLQDVREPARPAGQVLVDERPEHRPPQPRPVGDRGVDVGHGGHAPLDQRVGLLPQRGLQPVGDVPRHLLAQPDRLLPDRGVERQRPLDDVLAGLLPGHDLDQRDEVRRVERVPDQHALRVPGGSRGRSRSAASPTSWRRARRRVGRPRPAPRTGRA